MNETNFYNVLDDGFVKLNRFAGGDIDVVNGARISFHRQHKEMEEGDDKLINFLMKHRHGTPFENSWFSFHIRCPIAVAREWMRHRISSFNEISARYVKVDHAYYVPADEAVRRQIGKPGSYTFVPIPDPAKIQQVRAKITASCERAFTDYEDLLKMGVAKEVARLVLPMGTYTEFLYATNARSLMNFISLRNSPQALLEIREFAIVLERVFAKKMPITHEHFVANERVAP